jgi:hypothetical protein
MGVILLLKVDKGKKVPVSVAARSRAWTIFARLDAGIVCSNPTQGTDVWCMYAFILCLGSGLATGWSLVQGVLPSVKKWLRNWKRGLGPEWAGRTIERKGKKVNFSQVRHYLRAMSWKHGGVDPCTRWRCVVSFTPRQLYCRGNRHWYLSEGGWVAQRVGLDGVEKIKNSCPGH